MILFFLLSCEFVSRNNCFVDNCDVKTESVFSTLESDWSCKISVKDITDKSDEDVLKALEWCKNDYKSYKKFGQYY